MQNKRIFSKFLAKCDLGTVELAHKRVFHLTKEPLDLCFEKGLISLDEHQYGIRFRWLYSLKFGAIGVSSNFPQAFSSVTKVRDQVWLVQKQMEYKQVIESIKNKNSRKLLMDICIFNLWPIFLTKPQAFKAQRDFKDFQRAISELVDCFKKLKRH